MLFGGVSLMDNGDNSPVPLNAIGSRKRPRLFRPLKFPTKLLSLVVVMAFVTSACTGSSDDASPQAAGAIPTAVQAIAFASTDGSAFVGSRPVFTLTNKTTGAVVTAPVDGAGPTTRSEVYVDPGTYAVTAASQYVSATGSYTVRDISTAEVTVAATTDPSTPVTVTFGLDAQRSPFDFRIAGMTATQVDLLWEPSEGVEVGDYQLRRTDGAIAATGPNDGVAVALTDPAATTVSAPDLAPGTEYTFTLFATGKDGAPLATRSVSTTTPQADGSTASYALAPNTILPGDFAALQATALGDSRVSIALTPGNDERVSATEIPGVDAATLTSGCIVGLPILVSTEVAADQAFYGFVESCGVAPPSLRSTTDTAPVTAVVNTDVPIAAVIPYLAFKNSQVNPCFNAAGQALPADDALCAGLDSDGDGMKDTTELALGRNAADPADGWTSWLAEGRTGVPVPTTPAPSVTELEPPAVLGTGDVQVTLLWSTGDDLDLTVTDPSGADISYSAPRSASGGELDVDNLGDTSCQSTQTRAENVFWKENAPKGTYTIKVTNFLGAGDQTRAACSTAPVQARLEVRIGGKLRKERVLTVGVDGPVTFSVSDQPPYDQPLSIQELTLPAGMATGDLQVTTLWTSGDELTLLVTDPQGTTSSSNTNDSRAPGVVFNDTTGGSCDEPPVTRADNLAWPTGAPAGTYTVQTINQTYPTCGDEKRTEGWIEVRLRGQLILRDVIVLPEQKLDGTTASSEVLTFVVPPAPSGLRSPSAITAPAVSAKPAAGQPFSTGSRSQAALPGISCEGSNTATFDPGFGFGEFHNVDFELKYSSLRWDIRAGVTAGVNPSLVLEAKVECELEVDGVTFQLLTTPIPINLELDPVVEGSATGTFELTGPQLDLTFGLRTKGDVDASLDKCGWFRIPCGIKLDTSASAEPIGDFTHGDATMKVEGVLSLGLGVEATLGVGIKNTFVTAKSGFAIKMKPIVGTATASVSLSAGVSTEPEPVPVAEPRPSELSAPPPYNATDLQAMYVKQAAAPGAWVKAGPGSQVNEQWPVVGPISNGSCTDGKEPLAFNGISDAAFNHYRCQDSFCLDGGTMRGTYSTFMTCKQALCVVTDQIVDTGAMDDRITECPQGPVVPAGGALPEPGSADPSASAGDIGVDLNLAACASVALGAELGVDFRAEAFVLGWGEDRRYPIWEGEFDYPGATFEVGTCE